MGKTGYRLRFYERERVEFETEFDMVLSQGDAVKVSRKIARHFKFTAPSIVFRYNADHGLAKLGGWSMNLPKKPTLGILLHELAHFHNYEKTRNWNHNKKLMRTIRRFVKYCQKKDYWGFHLSV